MNKQYFNYWGKSSKGIQEYPFHYHLLPYHLLDVAAVGHVFLEENNFILEKILTMLDMEENTFRQWFNFLLSIHDIGKFSKSFQGLNREVHLELQGKMGGREYLLKHDTLGWVLWDKFLREKLREDKIVSKSKTSLTRLASQCSMNTWVSAVVGHHGKPPKLSRNKVVEDYFDNENIEAISDLLNDLIPLLLEKRYFCPTIDEEKMKRASWWLAGITVFSDWLGSNTNFFPYLQKHMSLESYWTLTKKNAKKAIDNVGLSRSKPSKNLAINELVKDAKSKVMLTPLQDLVLETEISNSPHVFILEDITGSGKTEASILLAHRLMGRGLGKGIYFALPTMATANAMYARMSSVYKKMFDINSPQPSIVLAHGSRDMSQIFNASISPSPENPTSNAIYEDGLVTADAHCNWWLADNKKKALLADVGVGTIDQALLAVLPSRHQSLRLFGLMNKILIVDEVHACDAYMNRLLKSLIYAHALSGGSVILLSATLPKEQRNDFLKCYSNAFKEELLQISCNNYPLLTSWSKDGMTETKVSFEEKYGREIFVNYLSNEETVYSLILEAVKKRQSVCWIRNTIKDAVASYREIKKKYPDWDIILFHARYALSDRFKIENRVIEYFGKKSTSRMRAGRVLIATQVVEQSLDLDFDILFTDLAPIDLIIQRAGRLHRHSRSKSGTPISTKDERGKASLYCLAPEFTKDPSGNWFSSFFPNAVKVYENHGHLWLTAKLIYEMKSFKFPKESRLLIESVYGNNDAIPEGLQEKTNKALGDEKAEASLGALNTIDIGKGYSSSLESDFIWDESHTPTRLGEKSMTVYLVKWKENKLEAWAKGEDDAWFLSGVNMRTFYIGGDNKYPEIPEEKLRKVKESLPCKGKWSALLPLSFSRGQWCGSILGEDQRMNKFLYSEDFGLMLQS